MISYRMNRRQKERYKTWSKYLKSIDVYKDQDFFLENFNKIDFSFTNVFGIRFFKDRYSFFLDEKTIEKLHLKSKEAVVLKRGSMYDVENVMKKKVVSFEEASKIVEERKNKTSGTFENFVKRYGEDAHKRFEIFKSKSKSTLDNFKLRYGDEGEDKWKSFLESRDSSSLEYYIKKYGKEDGTEKYNTYIEKLSFTNSLEGYKERYGEQDGERHFKEVSEKKLITIDYYTSKYGEEDGLKKYLESNYSKGKSTRLEYFIDKYGEVEGTKLFKKRSIRISPIFKALKNEYGEEEAYSRYEEYQKTKVVEPTLKTFVKNRYVKRSKSPHSKESVNFFYNLSTKLNRDLRYSKNGGEIRLFDKETNNLFIYDCYDECTNTLIEFQGVAFHPKQGDTEWVGAYGQTYEDVLNKDFLKKQFAEKSGYNLITIWSDEVNTKSKMVVKVNEVVEEINNENCKNRE